MEGEEGLAMEGVDSPEALSVPPPLPGMDTEVSSETEGELVLEIVT